MQANKWTIQTDYFVFAFRLCQQRERHASLKNTVKPVYNDHPWDPKIVAFVDRWSLFEGNLCNKSSKCDIEMVVVSLGLTVNPNLIQFSSFVQILNLRLDHNFGQNVECY